MTMELADKIEGLAAKATPGPWHKHTGAIGVNPWIGGSNGEKGSGEYVRGGCILNMVAHNEREEDASLIVELVNNLPAIIAALRTEPPADVAGLIHAAKMVVQGSDPLTLLRLEQALDQIERTRP